MTRKTFAPALVTLAAMLALVGCGGDSGLTATGSATITDSTSTSSGFTFTGVRIDGAGGTGRTTGMCTISRGASGVYGVVVDLYGDAGGQGHAVRSMSIMAHTDNVASGQIDADLGGTDFTGTCTVGVPTLDEGRGTVSLRATDCALTHGTDSVQANVNLDLSGCTVL